MKTCGINTAVESGISGTRTAKAFDQTAESERASSPSQMPASWRGARKRVLPPLAFTPRAMESSPSVVQVAVTVSGGAMIISPPRRAGTSTLQDLHAAMRPPSFHLSRRLSESAEFACRQVGLWSASFEITKH